MDGRISENSPAFDEVQWSPVWAMALVGFAALLALAACIMAFWRERSVVLLLPPVLVLLTFNVLRVRTQVNARFLTVTFGALFPLYRKRIRMAEITSAQAVIYDPIGEYGGWGIRGYSGDQCLNARGNEGVRLTLSSGDKLLVGSQKAEALVHALCQTGSVRPFLDTRVRAGYGFLFARGVLVGTPLARNHLNAPFFPNGIYPIFHCRCRLRWQRRPFLARSPARSQTETANERA